MMTATGVRPPAGPPTVPPAEVTWLTQPQARVRPLAAARAGCFGRCMHRGDADREARVPFFTSPLVTAQSEHLSSRMMTPVQASASVCVGVVCVRVSCVWQEAHARTRVRHSA
jgi:hypothetical protein